MQILVDWTLRQEGTGTVVTVNESMKGLLAILFKTKFNSSLHSDTNLWLSKLREAAE